MAASGDDARRGSAVARSSSMEKPSLAVARIASQLDAVDARERRRLVAQRVDELGVRARPRLRATRRRRHCARSRRARSRARAHARRAESRRPARRRARAGAGAATRACLRGVRSFICPASRSRDSRRRAGMARRAALDPGVERRHALAGLGRDDQRLQIAD